MHTSHTITITTVFPPTTNKKKTTRSLVKVLADRNCATRNVWWKCLLPETSTSQVGTKKSQTHRIGDLDQLDSQDRQSSHGSFVGRRLLTSRVMDTKPTVRTCANDVRACARYSAKMMYYIYVSIAQTLPRPSVCVHRV